MEHIDVGHYPRQGEADTVGIGHAAVRERGDDGEVVMGGRGAPGLADELDTEEREVFSWPTSRAGLLSAGLFVSFSLLPSLLPRTAVMQGIVSGITVALGYGVGTLVRWAGAYLGVPAFRGRVRRVLTVGWAIVLTVVLAWSVWRHVGWQNEVRGLFEMDPSTPTVWVVIIPVALLVAAVLLVLARAVRTLFRASSRRFERRLPRRVALLLGGAVSVVLLSLLWNGVLVDGFFALANRIFAPIDPATDEGVVRTASAARSGGPGSLVDWDTLGRKGRTFVATGPSVHELEAYHGREALEPIRVYAGLRSADTPAGRAELVLAELERTGAFEREVLVVATTTGTGYLEPNAMDSLEYVHNGDTAVAGVQYSYLPSWISLLADQDEVRATSRAVFDTVHAHWSTLPEDDRPRLYLYGLSLGSYGVESILSSINIVNEPIDGALLVGPPFVNQLWNDLVAGRDPESSPAAPVYERGRTVRFVNEGDRDPALADGWGRTRVLYLQHASDPVTFFSPDLLLDRPDWLLPDQRGADVPDRFTWVPLITMWQVLFDLPAAGSVPEGFGHLFTPEANAQAWIDVTRPEPWTAADSDALRRHLRALDEPPPPIGG
jgi:uncharacterized membrane protein